MTLPAFAAERRRLQQDAGSAPKAIDHRALSSKPAGRPPAAAAAVDQWDRQTDRHKDGHPTAT